MCIGPIVMKFNQICKASLHLDTPTWNQIHSINVTMCIGPIVMKFKYVMLLPSLTFVCDYRLEIYWYILIPSCQLNWKKHSHSSALKIIMNCISYIIQLECS
jgi:hypothetical protein